MSELGSPCDATAVARRYGDLIDGYVLDQADASCSAETGIYATIAYMLTLTLEDRDMSARDVLTTADRLSETRRRTASASSGAVVPFRGSAQAKQRLAPVLLSRSVKTSRSRCRYVLQA